MRDLGLDKHDDQPRAALPQPESVTDYLAVPSPPPTAMEGEVATNLLPGKGPDGQG
jgi:hypothetical protein